jgi:hypothetical protein
VWFSPQALAGGSGLKVYGEGEWKVRRTWRKLYLGISEATGEIVAETLTKNSF